MSSVRSSVFIAGVVGLALVGTGPAVWAQTSTPIYSCVTKSNGAIRIVSATTVCNTTKERSVVWNLAGPTGPQGPQGPIGDRGEPRPQGPAAETLAVYDANNNKVGDVVSIEDDSDAVMVARNVAGHPIVLKVFPDHFAGIFSQVYFNGTNCSGIPLLRDRSTPVPLIAVAAPGSTVYLADNQELPQTFYYNSTRTASFEDNAGGTCDSPGGNNPVNARPAIPLVDLDTLFTPPFNIR